MIKKMRLAVVCMLLSSAAAAGDGRYIVMFGAEGRSAGVEKALRSAGARVVRELSLINAAAVELHGEKSADALAAAPGVAGVFEDAAAFRLQGGPLTLESAFERARAAAAGYDDDLPWFPPPEPDQFIPWGIARTGAPAAWRVTRGGGVRVCVVDSGMDPRHKDLVPALAEGINTTEEGSPDDFNDWFGHGSHVAGTIAAADNAFGVVGGAPGVSLYVARVIRKEGGGRYSEVLAGIEWCVAKKARVLNLSMSVPSDYPPLRESMEAVEKAGVLVVAAAGNSGGPVEFPAAYPQVVAVGAMDQAGKAAAFSSRGPEVDFIAPGVDIASTYSRGMYSENSGTSMAAPHVSALAALAIAAGGLKTPEEARAALRRAAAPLPLAPQETQGAGFIDAVKLVAR